MRSDTAARTLARLAAASAPCRLPFRRSHREAQWGRMVVASRTPRLGPPGTPVPADRDALGLLRQLTIDETPAR